MQISTFDLPITTYIENELVMVKVILFILLELYHHNLLSLCSEGTGRARQLATTAPIHLLPSTFANCLI